ncbi:MAG: AAA family ATPase [Pirellulaceae bacterium]
MDDLWSELEKYGEVLKPISGERPELIARQEVVRQLEDWIFDHQGSAVLVGPSGVGKTAVLREVAAKLMARPDGSIRFLRTSSSSLVAGKKYIGEWQQVIKDLLALARQLPVVIWFEDFSALSGAGVTDTNSDNFASMLAPALDRKEVVIVGECTEQQYRKSMQANQWFARLVQKIQLPPLEGKDCRAAIESRTALALKELQTTLKREAVATPAAIDALVHYGRLYFPGVTAPAGSIQLLEWLMQHVERKWQSALEHQRQNRRVIRSRFRVAMDRVEEGPAAREVIVSSAPWIVDVDEVVQTLCSNTGLPRHLLDDQVPMSLSKTEEHFGTRIVGQVHAVREVVNTVALVKAGLADPSKPLSVLLFVGPTGVGKTELAKTLAEYVFGTSSRLIRFDMSEYQDYGGVERFLGAPGAAMVSPGLPALVRQSPFSVILLDEIEKAHPRMFDLLLQLFDAGRLTDLQGETANFSQTIIIMTSNIGVDLEDAQSFGFGAADHPEDNTFLALQQHFRPELLNRIDRVVRFERLDRASIRDIAQRELQLALQRDGVTRRGLDFDIDRSVIDWIARIGFDSRYGARPIKRAIERNLLVPLARLLASQTPSSQRQIVRLQLRDGRLDVSIKESDSKVEAKAAESALEAEPNEASRAVQGEARSGERLDQAREAMLEESTRLIEEIELHGVRGQRTMLLEAINSKGFWDRSETSQQAAIRLHRIERFLEYSDRELLEARELGLASVSSLPTFQPIDRNSLASQLEASTQKLRIARYMLRCSDAGDQRDLFLVFNALEAQANPLVKRLADAYRGWCSAKGFSALVVHDQAISAESPKAEVVLQVQGVAAYGILKGEQGLNRFHHSAKVPPCHIRIQVLPIEDAIHDADRAIDVQSRRAMEAGVMKIDPKTKSIARFRDGTLKVIIENGLGKKESEDAARELLLAERQRQRSQQTVEEESIARRWRMDRKPQVHDHRSGVTIEGLKEVWRGALDPLFLGNLEDTKTR